MTDEMEMMTNPELVEKRKELKAETGQLGGFNPAKSHVLPVIEEHAQDGAPGWRQQGKP
jgi:hypothetical protein